MTYALYADEWPMAMIRHRLDRSDRHLFTELLAHCTRNLTDGVVDVPLAMITDHDDPQAGVRHLIAAGLLDRYGEGLVISEEFYKHQPKREATLKKKEASRLTSQRNRMHNSGDHSLCDPQRCWVLRGKSDTSRDQSRNHVSDVPQSDPIRSDPQRIGEEWIEGSDDPGLWAGSSAPSQAEMHYQFPGCCNESSLHLEAPPEVAEAITAISEVVDISDVVADSFPTRDTIQIHAEAGAACLTVGLHRPTGQEAFALSFLTVATDRRTKGSWDVDGFKDYVGIPCAISDDGQSVFVLKPDSLEVLARLCEFSEWRRRTQVAA